MSGTHASFLPEAIRVCVLAPDPELRAWLVDELSLMTWIGALQLEIVPDAESIGSERDLVILGLDAIVAARSWSAPTISIGRCPEHLTVERVLPANATSRELKQAIREELLPGRHAVR
jgi:hypothetical protein